EPGAQRADVDRPLSHLPQDPRRAERPPAREVLVLQHADALRDRAVEGPHLLDRARGHSLTLVREHAGRQPRGPQPPALVTRETSAIEGTPWRTLSRPSSRRRRMPLRTATAATRSADAR